MSVRPQAAVASAGNVERRIGQDVVSLQIEMPVVVESVSMGNLTLGAQSGEAYLSQSPSRIVRFLAADRYVGLGTTAKSTAVVVAWRAGRQASGVDTNVPH